MADKRYKRTTSSLLPELRKHHDVLPWEEQLALIKEHHASKDEEVRLRIEETLLLHNIGFIKDELGKQTGGISSNKITYDEQFLRVCWEYVRAIRNFNPKMGTRLNTYASWWIWKGALEILRETDRSSSVIHIPVRVRRQMITVRKFGSTPPKKIAAKTGIPEEEVRFLQRLDGFMGELDACISDNTHHSNKPDLPRSGLVEQHMFPNALEVAIKRDLLRAALEHLSERERTTLMLRTQGDTLREVGKKLNVSHERVRQIAVEAEKNARRFAYESEILEKTEEAPKAEVHKRGAHTRHSKTRSQKPR